MKSLRYLWLVPLSLGLAPVYANSGYDDAMFAFENRDYTSALQHIEPLARSGDLAAMTLLGRVYDEGFHEPLKALPWYRQAAEKGDADAQVQLAELYDAGEGVPADMDAAVFWYEKAAAQGHEEAELALAQYYSDDLGDNLRAKGYYQQAADQGSEVAQLKLGLLYLGETGIERDVVQAWLYLSLAAERLPEAADTRDVLELNISSVDLAKAKQQLSMWQASH